MGNRKKATELAVARMKELSPYTDNHKLLEDRLNRLTDAQFADYMKALRDGEEIIPIYVPPLQKKNLDKGALLAIAKRWGVEVFQHMWIDDPDTGRPYKTPVRYMSLLLPVGRLAQTQESKVSLPEDQMHVDELTAQVTGASKGARISFPELSSMAGKEALNAVIESVKVRGGDEGSLAQFNHDVILNGFGDLEKAVEAESGVKSTQNLATFLRTIHLNTTVDKKG